MSALGGAKPAGSSTGIAPVPALVSLVIFVIIFALMYQFGGSLGMTALIGIVIGGLLIGFGVHFVPVGGAPAAMGQAPGIATGVAMLAAGGGLAGLFGGAWAASTPIPLNPVTLLPIIDPVQQMIIIVLTGAIGGGLMLAITCFFVNFIYIYGMGIPAASGKVKKDPITGDTQPEFKSQGTEGHGLPFVSFVGGVIGGILGGAGGTLVYLMLLNVYQKSLPVVMKATDPTVTGQIAISLAGMFAVGIFLVIAVLAAYNITGTIEGPHDPKFKRFPRALIASAVASALCGVAAILLVMV